MPQAVRRHHLDGSVPRNLFYDSAARSTAPRPGAAGSAAQTPRAPPSPRTGQPADPCAARIAFPGSPFDLAQSTVTLASSSSKHQRIPDDHVAEITGAAIQPPLGHAAATINPHRQSRRALPTGAAVTAIAQQGAASVVAILYTYVPYACNFCI